MKSPSIRPMCSDDMAEVLAIEQLASASPWRLKQFQQSIGDTFVLSVAGEVVGFAVVVVAADQAELHNLAIHPHRQSCGLGTLLINDLISHLPEGINRLYLEVRQSNFRAIRLYQQLEFVEIGQRRGYYPGEFGREDALLMCREIISSHSENLL